MRHIVLDSETTGRSPDKDDRIVELGGIELIDLVPTGKYFHYYINPGRPIPERVSEIHGITDAMVADKPFFSAYADKFMEFIGEKDAIVAHNGTFDLRFLNAELGRINYPLIEKSRLIDTLPLARKHFPKQHNTLDDLCERFGIDNSMRPPHGALLDSQLLGQAFCRLQALEPR